MRRFEHPLSQVPQFTGLRFYTFPGGCITNRFSFPPGASPVPAHQVAGSAYRMARDRALCAIETVADAR